MRRVPRARHRSRRAVATGHYIGVLAQEQHRAARSDQRRFSARGCATGRSSGFIASGTSGTTIRRRSSRVCCAAAGERRRRSPAATQTHAQARADRSATSRRCCAPPLITIVLSCLAMALAVFVGVLVASGRVYGNALVRAMLTDVRRSRARHAGAAAALRPLLRPLGRDPAAGVRRRAARPRAELRRVRERDLSRRAGGGAARTARGGADARPHRDAGLAARARAAGVPPRARADDERLRRAAEGLVARLGDHRRRADEADGDLRHEHRQLGRSPASLCAALYLVLSLPLSRLARTAGDAMEGGRRNEHPARSTSLRLRRGDARGAARREPRASTAASWSR